jgi:hypothetical protein
MMRIDRTQWAALARAHDQRLEQRLVAYLERHLGAATRPPHHRSPREIVSAALPFSRHIGAETEAQVARTAILLAAIHHLEPPPEQVRELRTLVTCAGKPIDHRLADAAARLRLVA